MLFQKSSPLFRGAFYAVMAMLAISIGSYFASTHFAERQLSLFRWYESPSLTDTKGQPTQALRPGDGFVINYFVEREPLKCWATYINMIKGENASYQFPAQRTHIISDTRVKTVIHVYQQLPTKFPAGEYSITQLVYPTCMGHDLPPFGTDTGIRFTVLEPDAPKPVVVRVEREQPQVPDLEISPDSDGEYLIPSS